MSSDPAPPLDSADNALLVAQMRPALVKYFKRKCGSAAEAEDLTQDVLLRALARGSWHSPEQARGYVFRAAVNRWRDRNRRMLVHGATIHWDDSAAYATDEETSPEDVLVIEQQLHGVAQALLELSERTRDVFMLIRLEQMKQADIARMLGISVSAVEKHLARALAHLARHASRLD
jgi:RNA polymerase sigma factor (sigma-70 family)